MMMMMMSASHSNPTAGKSTTDVIEQSTSSLVFDGLKEIGRGLMTVLKHHPKESVTLEYPEVMPELSDRFHGRLSLLSKSDGTDLCIGCQACAKVCPCDDLIQIDMHRDADKKPVIDRFTIDLGRCIFCGNCTEVCPVDCIKFLPDFELADYSREALVLDKKDLTLSGEASDEWRRTHGLDPSVA
jgi:NADH-quinone oxidoreductase subunit I